MCTLGLKNLSTIIDSSSVEDCIQRMLADNVRHLLVHDKSKEIVGIIAMKDVMQAMLNHHDCTINSLNRIYFDDIVELS